jgi:hypothetical protein
MTKKITVFWYMKPCSLADHHQHYGGVSCLHLQGRTVSRAWIEVAKIQGREDVTRAVSKSVGRKKENAKEY